MSTIPVRRAFELTDSGGVGPFCSVPSAGDIHLRSLLDDSVAAFLGIDESGLITLWNREAQALLGHHSESVLGRPADEVLVPSRLRPHTSWLETTAHREPIRTTVTNGAGDEVPVELAVWDGCGFGLPRFTVCLRVTAHPGQEARGALSMLEATLESTADGILVVDLQGKVVGRNRTFSELWRIPRKLEEGGDDDRLISYVSDQLKDPAAFLSKVRELYATPEASSTDVLEFVDGRVFGRYSQPQRVDGQVVGRVWSFRDLTAQHRLELDLRRQALTDPLTGLPNRQLFMDRLTRAEAQSRATGTAVAVCLLDLDEFKYVNDEFGHLSGDKLLCAAAERFMGVVRDTDTVARLGGDEFGVLIPDATVETARRITERLAACFGRPVQMAGHSVRSSVSVGYTLSDPTARRSAEDLLHEADLAMYGAKSAGAGRVRRFSVDLVREDRRILCAEMNRILDDPNGLDVHLQPIRDLATGAVRGYEALSRFPGSEQRSVGEWFTLARSVGKAPELEARSLLLALERPRPDAAFLSVNISPHSLVDPQVQEVLDRDLHGVVIEITEDTPLDIGQLDSILASIRERGGGIAVDDTGAGYDGLRRLVRLRPEIVKLDREFVHQVQLHPEKRALVEAMVGFCRRTGSLLCAEGVEEPEELATLVGLGVPVGQGWLLGRPSPGAVPTSVEPWPPAHAR